MVWGFVSFCFIETGCNFVVQADLEFIAQADLKQVIFLPLPPKCWDYWHASQGPCTFSAHLCN
jgi:hypothetical protein